MVSTEMVICHNVYDALALEVRAQLFHESCVMRRASCAMRRIYVLRSIFFSFFHVLRVLHPEMTTEAL